MLKTALPGAERQVRTNRRGTFRTLQRGASLGKMPLAPRLGGRKGTEYPSSIFFIPYLARNCVYVPKKFFKGNDFAGTFNNIIQSKACQINLYKGPDSFRSAIAKERLKAGLGKSETLLHKQVQEEAPLSDDYEKVVIRGANTNEDSNSIACIGGLISGAYLGIN